MSIDTSTPAANEELALNDEACANTSCRVMLVCNQAHIIRVLKTQLEQQGCWVSTARSAERALEKLHASSYTAVVVDTDVAGMGALQLCMNIDRQIQQNKPRVFLSGAAAIDMAQQTTDWPINAEGLDWPISVTYLLAAINPAPTTSAAARH